MGGLYVERLSLGQYRGPLQVEVLLPLWRERREKIHHRLEEFRAFGRIADDQALFSELVFCILAAGTSARMALKFQRILEPLLDAPDEILFRVLQEGRCRFHTERAIYICSTRRYLKTCWGGSLQALLSSTEDWLFRRDLLAKNPEVKGIGYKEASHFLRNIGFFGYAILDKHIIYFLHQLGVCTSSSPPTSRKRYLEMEEKEKAFAHSLGLTLEELDLLLWSLKTGELIK